MPKAKELIADEKRRKMGKVGIFLEQLEEIGRWTVTHAAFIGSRVFSRRFVFPLDLYSGEPGVGSRREERETRRRGRV